MPIISLLHPLPFYRNIHALKTNSRGHKEYNHCKHHEDTVYREDCVCVVCPEPSSQLGIIVGTIVGLLLVLIALVVWVTVVLLRKR